MAKLTLSTINSRYASVAALNANFQAIVTALENTLSRDGTSPNTLSATLDMDSNRIVNVADPVNASDVVTKGWLEEQPNNAAADAAAAAVSAAAALASEVAAEAAAGVVVDWDFIGQWTTATAYLVNNIVTIPSGAYQGWSFICIVAHTSGGTFATDYSGGKWEVVAQRGAAGAGTGDMLAANNLSDVSSISSARTNLGLTALATTTPGTGVATALAVNIGSAGAPVLFNGAGGTPASLTLTNATGLPMAAQSDQETATSTTLPVTPGRQHHHPSAAKFWVSFNSSGTIQASYNVSSVTKNGTGDFTVNITTAFSSAEWCANYSTGHISGVTSLIPIGIAQTSSTFRLQTVRLDTGGVGDPDTPNRIYVMGYGDL
jgi:hypothetical protein